MDKAFPSLFPSLLAQWRDASRAAHEAERVMIDAAMRYASGQGPKPSDEFMDEVKRLRAEAGELFKQVMAKSQGGQSLPFTHPPSDSHAQH